MADTKLTTQQAFKDASEQVKIDLKKAIEESSEHQSITSSIARLDEIRKDGLFKARETRRQIEELRADHRLDIARQKASDRRQQEAMARESARKVVALKFHIADLEKQIREDHRKELSREKGTILSLTYNVAPEDRNIEFLEQYDLELPDTLKGIHYLQSIDDKVMAGYTENQEKLSNEVLSLQSELANLKANSGDPHAILDLKVQITEKKALIALSQSDMKNAVRLVSEFNRILPEDPKYFEKIGKVAREALIFSVSAELNRAKALRKSQAMRIEGEHKLALQAEKKASQQRVQAIAEDQSYLAKLDELSNSLAEAEAIQASRQEEAKGVADGAYVSARTLFEGLLAQIRAERKTKRAELSARLKTFIAENKGDKEAIDKETEAIYRELALGGVAESFVLDSYHEVTGRISASVRDSRRHRIDSDIVRYYKPEEVIEDPSLVDTASMRLVIHATEGKQVDVKAIEKRDKISHAISLTFIYIFLVIMAILVLFPFYWMFNTSLKSTQEIVNSVTPTLWPETVMWSNYVEVFDRFDFITYLVNTLIVGIVSTLGVLITCVLSAFAFARLKFTGRDTVFMTFLATMMIPGEMMVITNYITVSNFGWIGANSGRLDAYFSMIFPFCVSVFYTYLLRQNFKQIPEELYLAAKVDGKSDWNFLWTVMVPLCQSTLLTIGILSLMGNWNAYVWPNLVASRDTYRLISNGLRNSFTSSSGIQEYGLQMAATVYVTVPLLLLFICFRKYIMRGVGRAGIKG